MTSTTTSYAQDSDVKSFVLTRYLHGIPYQEARAFGTEAIPELTKLLHDKTYSSYWGNIVGVLGNIGNSSAREILMNFLVNLSGEVPIEVFRAALGVPGALGHLSGDGDDRAMEFLIQIINDDPSTKQFLKFSFNLYQGEKLQEVMGRMSIQGLGVSGRNDAKDFLKSKILESKPDWQDNYSEAIEINQIINEKGAAKYFSRK